MWLTLSGEFLSDEGASCWFPPFTFLFFLATAPPPPFSPPALAGELFCWNSFSWAAQMRKTKDEWAEVHVARTPWPQERNLLCLSLLLNEIILLEILRALSSCGCQELSSPFISLGTPLRLSDLEPLENFARLTKSGDLHLQWGEARMYNPIFVTTKGLFKGSGFKYWLECVATAFKILSYNCHAGFACSKDYWANFTKVLLNCLWKTIMMNMHLTSKHTFPCITEWQHWVW